MDEPSKQREGIGAQTMQRSLVDVNFNQDIVVNYLNTRPKSGNVLNHYHDYYEIYFYLGNHMRYFIKEKPHEVQQNDVVLIDRFAIHSSRYRSDQRHHRFLILFNPAILEKPGREVIRDNIQDLFRNSKLTLVSERRLSNFREKVQLLHEICIGPEHPLQEEQLEYELLSLLLFLLGLDEDEVSFNHEIESLSSSEQLVRKATSYIDKNFRREFRLDALAGELFVSKYYLSRTFNAELGMSISEFLNARRLSEAERLIRYSKMNISEISREVGFSSSSYFIKLFKEKYDCTPQMFRDALSA